MKKKPKFSDSSQLGRNLGIKHIRSGQSRISFEIRVEFFKRNRMICVKDSQFLGKKNRFFHNPQNQFFFKNFLWVFNFFLLFLTKIKKNLSLGLIILQIEGGRVASPLLGQQSMRNAGRHLHQVEQFAPT